MVNFLIGVICGISFTMGVYFLGETKKIKQLVEELEKRTENVLAEAEEVIKPDNKAARYYGSLEYKREKQFIEEEAAKRKRRAL
jgi:hypothetical protein